jgi:hypothetical protein
MTQTRQFIDQLAAGESSSAKDTLENLISIKAFESLDAYKKEISSSIFGGIQEETEEFDMEEVELDEASKPVPVDKKLSQQWIDHVGHYYNAQQGRNHSYESQAKADKIYKQVHKTHGPKVANAMASHSSHIYDDGDESEKAKKLRNKHGISHPDYDDLHENYEQLDENMRQAVSLMKKANAEHIDKDIHAHYPKILDAVKKSGNEELHKKLSHHFGKAIEHNKQKHASWNKAGERPSAAYNRSLDKSIDHHIQASRTLGVEKGLDKFTRHDD